MRVYLPTTLRGLGDIWAGGAVPASRVWFAVTPALREWYEEGDEEELEYAAMAEAARASVRALAADGSPPRRVVVAADVRDTAATPSAADGRAAVVVTDPVPVSAMASVHVDDPEAEPDVRAAAQALPAADAGDEDAAFAVEAVEDHDLLWYATQEVPDLLRAAG